MVAKGVLVLDVGPLCSREEVKDFYTNENAQFPIFPAFLDPLPHNFLLLPPTDRLLQVHWRSLTGLPNKACPRLCDLATAPARGITQPTGCPKVRAKSNHTLNFGIG